MVVQMSSYASVTDHSTLPSNPAPTPVAGASYCGAAQNFAQLCVAYGLVHTRYIQQGYANENETGMRYSLWNLIPQATTFVVEESSNIQGTLTIVIDSACGLPAEKEFPREFTNLRARGSFIAEATMFAAASGDVRSLDVSSRLMTMAVRWCLEAGIDDLCMTINPRHAGFYERVLGFERLGVVESMGHVEGHPGILLRCNLSNALEAGGAPEGRASRLLAAARMEGKISFNRTRLTEVEVAVLLDGNPGIYFDAAPEQRAVLERLYPLACKYIRVGYDCLEMPSNRG